MQGGALQSTMGAACFPSAPGGFRGRVGLELHFPHGQGKERGQCKPRGRERLQGHTAAWEEHIPSGSALGLTRGWLVSNGLST